MKSVMNEPRLEREIERCRQEIAEIESALLLLTAVAELDHHGGPYLAMR